MKRVFVTCACLTLVPLVVTGVALAAAGKPKVGTYHGHTTTNVAGNAPLDFEMAIARAKCAGPGGGKPHQAYCVTVAAASLIQAPCPGQEFVSDEFFPVTEPVALSAKRRISHLYTLYTVSGGTYDHPVRGATRVGTFKWTLQVDTRGNATGTADFEGESCASGLVHITAKLKK